MDYLASTTDSPLVIAVVDFEGGGRMMCMMTDRELDEVHAGLPVEMSFRKLRVVNGIHNYFWKAIPQRATVPGLSGNATDSQKAGPSTRNTSGNPKSRSS